MSNQPAKPEEAAEPMTRVDFYVLPTAGPQDRARLVCRLTEKAYLQGHRIYIHTDSAASAAQLDELLWTFSQGSFLPHGLAGEVDAAETAILLGHDHEPETHNEVLINHAHEVPLFFGRFERVAELVDQQPEHLQQARQRYSFYRERGYALNSHKLKG
ncbi:DNA polymerase III subunit chi [Thiohalobacter sp. IOR34]|uniref:DNA polymerase III subunit chi n=1 Tax=Thiohalobacter sp. IOR34 TaxID=3057176 RepID=UPI0025B21635|nr:DNA polymerase III subunit chi [Thiohalobacter sp. IOR34]WJW74981.1 DNA polymerase III subunit chi [Thiohalobacter sp. IOR34]